MHRRVAILLVIALVAGQSGFAKIGTIDVAPAATLLIPYFEVDVSDSSGVTTLIGLQNASATAMMLSVTLWTDYGIPTQHFNIYLTGFDTQTLNLRDVIALREIPITASDGQDPADTGNPSDGISNQGVISQDINFASCNGFLPNEQTGWVAPDLAAAHQGLPSANYFGGLCGARNWGDGIARGYVTIDTANSCSVVDAADPAFWASVATSQNTIVGDYSYVDASSGAQTSYNAVHIEAASSWAWPPVTIPPGSQTFYGRVVGFSATDQREALPTAFALPVSSGRSTLTYWRDSGVMTAPFACGSSPAPLTNKKILGFGPEENPLPVASQTLLPLMAGRVEVGAGGVPVTTKRGWLFVNLNSTTLLPGIGDIRQGWVSVEQRPESLPGTTPFAQGNHGIQLGNAADAADPMIP